MPQPIIRESFNKGNAPITEVIDSEDGEVIRTIRQSEQDPDEANEKEEER